MRTLSIVLILFVTPFLYSCDKPQKEPEKQQITEKKLYRDALFGFSMKVPSSWSAQNQNQQKEMMEQGSELISGDDPALKSMTDNSIERTKNLFAFFKHEPNSLVMFNPSIISVAENLESSPEIQSGSDYLAHVRLALEMSMLPYTFEEETQPKDISGKPFDIMSASVNNGIFTVQQEYYATVIADYALTIIISYSNDEEQNELNDILDTLTFPSSQVASE